MTAKPRRIRNRLAGARIPANTRRESLAKPLYGACQQTEAYSTHYSTPARKFPPAAVETAMNLTLRPAGVDDLSALVELENRCFDYDRLSRRN